MALRTNKPVHQSQKKQNVHKRNYDEKAIESFKQQLREIGLSLKNARIPMKHIYEIFMKYLFGFMIIFSKNKSTDKNQKSSQSLDNERNR